MLLVLFSCHLAKYLVSDTLISLLNHVLQLVLPKLIRICERLIDKTMLKCLMQSFAMMRGVEGFHKDDVSFDFVKAKQGKLVVDHRKHINANEPTLILANDTSVLGYLWLINRLSPLFVTIDFA